MGSSVILPSPGQPTKGPDPGFKTAAIPNAVSFAFSGIAPPASLYVQKDDILLLTGITNQAAENVLFNVRFLRLEVPLGGQPDHPPAQIPPQGVPVQGTIITFQKQVALPNLRTVVSTPIQLGEGFILSVDAVALVAAQTRGQTFARAEIIRGASINLEFAQLFLSDYVDALFSISWPGGTQRHATEGPGWIHSLNVANPAAGADWTMTVPVKTRMRIASLQAQLVTSAAVANRNVQVVVDDGVNSVWTASVAAAIPATTTDQIVAAQTNSPTGVLTTIQSVVVPPGLIIPAGFRVRTITGNIQAGDQWGPIWLLVEEWLDF